MPTIAIVVPVFNEKNNLPVFIQSTSEVCAGLAKKHGATFKLIFVDDGSTDGSAEWLMASAKSSLPIELVKLSRNFGKEAAICAGLSASDSADAIVIMDADLQHPPELIDTFLGHWLNDGYDVVYANRNDRQAAGGGLSFFSRLFYSIINSGSRFEIPRDAGDFRLINRRATNALLLLPENERFMKGLYAWIGFRQKGVSFRPAERLMGETGFSPLRLMLLSIDGLTSFTIAPLRYMAGFGLVICVLSFLYGGYIIAERLFWGNEIPGFASVITLISFFGGMQFVCLGIIGEYVGKALIETKKRPQYIVEDRTTIPKSEETE